MIKIFNSECINSKGIHQRLQTIASLRVSKVFNCSLQHTFSFQLFYKARNRSQKICVILPSTPLVLHTLHLRLSLNIVYMLKRLIQCYRYLLLSAQNLFLIQVSQETTDSACTSQNVYECSFTPVFLKFWGTVLQYKFQ